MRFTPTTAGVLLAGLAIAGVLGFAALEPGQDAPPPAPPPAAPPAAAPDDAELARLRARLHELEGLLAARPQAAPERPPPTLPPAPESSGVAASASPPLAAAAEPAELRAGAGSDGVRGELQRLLARLDDSVLEEASFWRRLTQLYLLVGDHDGAMRSLVAMYPLAPGSDFFADVLEEIPPELRLAGLQQLTERFPEDEELWGHLGDSHRALDSHDLAVAAYVRAVEQDPTDAEWTGKLAELDPLRAVPLLERSVQLHDRDDELLGNLADAYRTSERGGDALATYLRAHALDPWDREWLRRVTELAPDQGVALVSAQLEERPDEREYWAILGDGFQRLGDTDAAADAFIEALRRSPREAEYLERLIGVAPDRALTHLHERLSERPTDDEVWGDLGDVHRAMGNDAEALRHYQKAHELDENDREWPPKIAEIEG